MNIAAFLDALESSAFAAWLRDSLYAFPIIESFHVIGLTMVFGTIAIALTSGGADGPWIAGAIYDATGSYRLAFLLAIACCVVSAAAIWIAAPRKVRLVPGQIKSR